MFYWYLAGFFEMLYYQIGLFRQADFLVQKLFTIKVP